MCVHKKYCKYGYCGPAGVVCTVLCKNKPNLNVKVFFNTLPEHISDFCHIGIFIMLVICVTFQYGVQGNID